MLDGQIEPRRSIPINGSPLPRSRALLLYYLHCRAIMQPNHTDGAVAINLYICYIQRIVLNNNKIDARCHHPQTQNYGRWNCVTPDQQSNDQHSSERENNIIVESVDYNIATSTALLLQVNQFLSIWRTVAALSSSTSDRSAGNWANDRRSAMSMLHFIRHAATWNVWKHDHHHRSNVECKIDQWWCQRGRYYLGGYADFDYCGYCAKSVCSNKSLAIISECV